MEYIPQNIIKDFNQDEKTLSIECGLFNILVDYMKYNKS